MKKSMLEGLKAELDRKVMDVAELRQQVLLLEIAHDISEGKQRGDLRISDSDRGWRIEVMGPGGHTKFHTVFEYKEYEEEVLEVRMALMKLFTKLATG